MIVQFTQDTMFRGSPDLLPPVVEELKALTKFMEEVLDGRDRSPGPSDDEGLGIFERLVRALAVAEKERLNRFASNNEARRKPVERKVQPRSLRQWKQTASTVDAPQYFQKQ